MNPQSQIFISPVWGRSNPVKLATMRICTVSVDAPCLLRVSNPDAQDLCRRNSHQQINCVRLTYGHRNPLISSPSIIGGGDKHEQYSGSHEHKHYLGSAFIHVGCIEENQHNTELNDNSKPHLVYEQNQQMNQPSLRGSVWHNLLRVEPQCLQVTKSHPQNSPGVAQNYTDDIVGQILGTQRAINWRLISFSCFFNSCLISISVEFNAANFSGKPLLLISFTAVSSSCGLLISDGNKPSVSPVIKATLCLHNTVAGQSHEIPIWLATSKTFTSYRSVLLLLSAENLYSIILLSSILLSDVVHFRGCYLDFFRWSALSLRPQASSTHDEKLTAELSSFSRSMLASMWSISSCGKRMPTREDLLFLFPVAMTKSLIIFFSECTPYIKDIKNKMLDVDAHQIIKWLHTISASKVRKLSKTTPPQGITSTEQGLTTTVNRGNSYGY